MTTFELNPGWDSHWDSADARGHDEGPWSR